MMTADWLSCLKLIFIPAWSPDIYALYAMLLQSNKRHFLRAYCLPTIVQYAVGLGTWSYEEFRNTLVRLLPMTPFISMMLYNFQSTFVYLPCDQ